MATLASRPEPSQTPLSTATTAVTSSTPSTTTKASASDDAFTFPPIYAFPPFFTLQPNPTTLSSQLLSWSTLIQSYCRAHRLFTLTLVDALSSPLFANPTTGRKLTIKDARTVINWMASPEGGHRAEWITASGNGRAAKGEETGRCWVYWKRPEEWAASLEEWVERTGQRGTVITLYEIGESDATKREEFHGIDGELLTKSLQLCVKRGKAQIFGAEGSEGVKFF